MATTPRSRSAYLSRLILAGLCVVSAGCGGDDDSSRPASDTVQIRAVVERLLESESVEDQCEGTVSARFVREVYVTRARCRRANEPDADETPPDTAKVVATRIEGNKATTGVILTSVKGARATGRLALVKTSGTWKVDRFGVGFLRSVFAALPKQVDDAHERLVLECLAQATRRLSDREVRRLGNLVFGEQLKAEFFPRAALRCIRSGAGSTATA